MKLAARRVLSPDGVFVNDLHDPSAYVVEDPTPLWLNPNQVLGGSILGASMATLPANIAMMALDLDD